MEMENDEQSGQGVGLTTSRRSRLYCFDTSVDSLYFANGRINYGLG